MTGFNNNLATYNRGGYYSFEGYEADMKGRPSRKVANNTYLKRRDEDTIAVLYHSTDIVTYHRDGRIVLDSGGWLTYTTKDRFNRFSPAMVYSVKGRWFVNYGGGTYAYADGMTLLPDGTVEGAVDEATVKAQDKAANKVKRDVKKFIDSITPERIVEAIENPGGDCWGCKFGMGGDDCLALHVEEGYFHAHLLYRAVKAKGYRNPDVIMAVTYGDAKRGRVNSHITRDLASFLRKALIKNLAVVTR